MPWSAGVYTRAYPSWVNDANNNLPISATKFDLEDNDFASGINQTMNVTGINGLWKQTTQELGLGITPSSYLFPPLDARRYGADPTGVADSTAAFTNAIAVAVAIGSGVVTAGAGGTFTCSGSLTQESQVTLDLMGATLISTVAGTCIGSPATGALNYAKMRNGIINGGATAVTMLAVASGYSCTYNDLQFLSNSTTNTVIACIANTTGTSNPVGNLNGAQCEFRNISQAQTPGGNGCGTFIFINGNSGIQGIVTDNEFINCQAQLVNVCGVNFGQWCDSNNFTGLTRIGLNGNISPANGVAVIFASGAGGGVYSEYFEHLAIDIFANPAVDNRFGVQCTSLLSTKNIHIMVLECGPQREAFAVNFTAGAVLSGIVNIAPRNSTNYQSINFLGSNIGIGLTGNTSAACLAGIGAWLSGAAQYVYFAQGSAYPQGAPALGVCYAAAPGAATAGSPYTVAQVMGFEVQAGVNGTNATVTNSYGYYCADQNYATNNNYGFFSQMAAGAGKFGFFSAGTAANQFNGPTAVGGSITNDSASAGFVAETISSTIGSGSAVALSNGTPANVTSISLTAGDWDVWGQIAFLPTGTTTVTGTAGGVSLVSASFGSGFNTGTSESIYASFAPGANAITQTPPCQRISLATTTPVYLVAQANFATSTMSAYGSITARRRR